MLYIGKSHSLSDSAGNFTEEFLYFKRDFPAALYAIKQQIPNQHGYTRFIELIGLFRNKIVPSVAIYINNLLSAIFELLVYTLSMK